MPSVSTRSIILRRLEYGDSDLIITFFSIDHGKISLIAKSAKKSKKRFQGTLELFSESQIVYNKDRAKGLPVLQEASLINSFSNICRDIKKTAYAGYMAEIINEFLEEGICQSSVYRLLKSILFELDLRNIDEDTLSIIFQIRFMILSGIGPNLGCCGICRTIIENINQKRIAFVLKQGAIICERCLSAASGVISLSKGTIKHLIWAGQNDLEKALRVKFSHPAMIEAINFLEAFVQFHSGKEPKSLKFLRQIRSDKE
jgi:DNA repair protein RecO (recombination protein O)